MGKVWKQTSEYNFFVVLHKYVIFYTWKEWAMSNVYKI